jgi:MalT-like TPR region
MTALATLLDLGNTQLEQGDLAAARKSIEETRLLARNFPGAIGTPEIEMALARLSFAGGNFADAASHARAALSGFTAAGRESDKYQAAAVLTRSLIAHGSAVEASQVLAQVGLPDAKKFPADCVFQFQIARCFVLAHTGHREEAVRTMDAIKANAAHSGFPRLVGQIANLRTDF